MSKTTNHLKEAFDLAYARTQRYHALVVLLDNIVGEVRDRYSSQDPVLQQAHDTLRSRLLSRESDAWRDAMMWGGLVGGAEEHKVRLAAKERFLSKKMGVMWALEPDGHQPGGWSGETEEEFRQQIDNAFGEMLHGTVVKTEGESG